MRIYVLIIRYLTVFVVKCGQFPENYTKKEPASIETQ